jgi:AraC family transcriptional regulator of arabinose operon
MQPVREPPARAEGFAGQVIHVLPRAIQVLLERHSLLKGLHATRAGYFPNAGGHCLIREQGIDEAILILCLEGAGWHLDHRGRRVPVSAGSAVLIPPGLRHAYGADAHSPWTISWVHFRGAEMTEWISLLGSVRKIRLLKSGHEAQAALESLLQDYAGGFALANLIGAASVLRYALARLHSGSRTHSGKDFPADDRIEDIAQWMKRHLGEACSLAQMARQAGLSVPHFMTLFRARMGTSPAHYFLRLKMQRACHLLDTTALPVKMVADQLGIPDPYYFSRIFRKIMGVSPRRYRQMEKI